MNAEEIKLRAERLLAIFPGIMMSFSRMHTSKRSEMTFNQYQTLLIISKLQSCSVNQLAKILGLAQSTTSQLIDRLVTASLVTREINPKNRRKMIVTLSPEGEEMMKQRSTKIKKGYEKFLSMMSQTDQEKFEEAFNILFDIAKKIERMH